MVGFGPLVLSSLPPPRSPERCRPGEEGTPKKGGEPPKLVGSNHQTKEKNYPAQLQVVSLFLLDCLDLGLLVLSMGGF